MLAGGIYERTSGAAGQPLEGGYRRRAPEQTVLHELVSRHAQTLLAEMRDTDGRGLPRYVDRELAEYLRCGILAHGFARVRCQACDDELLVAFSCKRRGICPSCTAQRMADTAAHLVDRVLPSAPYRQWVLSVPKPLRLRLARDPAWTSWVGGLVVRAIGAWQRRIARARGVDAPRTGAITFVQRFGGLVNLNVHFHLTIPDGVFADAGDGLSFVLLPAPTGADLLALLDRVIRRVARRLAHEAGESDDACDADQPPDLFAQVQAEAATTWRSPATATSHVVRGSDRLRAWCNGFSLHAGVVIPDYDRDALERLCRYGARPAFAHDRLTWTADGRISYQLKRPWPDGRTHLVLEPVAFLRRLVGIIPPPRRHLLRTLGCSDQPAKLARSSVRWCRRPRPPLTTRPTLAAPVPRSPSRHAPADCRGLTCCAACSPWMFFAATAVAAATSWLSSPTPPARSLLTTIGLPAEPATFAPTRDPPQAELIWQDPP